VSARAASAPVADPHRPWTAAEKAGLAREIAATYVRVRWWLRRGTVEQATATAREGLGADEQPERHPGEYHLGLRLGRIVEANLGRLPGDTRCLTRSLVLVRMLARRGIASHLVIGVQAQPAFTAHAWVELDGHPLLNPGEYQSGRLTQI
jgi:Transglutaminase-like superfamily